jgi:hypothetical protein
MKPLSEKELREKLKSIIEKYNGSDPPAYPDEIEEHLALILQERQAWGEYVIGTSSLSMVMSPAIRLKNGHIDTSWTDEHDKYKAAYIEDGLRAEQRQRNQGEKD